MAANAHVDGERYAEEYARSTSDPDAYWAEQAAANLHWFDTWDAVSNHDFREGRIEWFPGARLNASYNCLDRHLEEHAERNAIIWEGDDPDQIRRLSYAELHQAVCRFANALKGIGVKQGQRICLYMPMIPELAIAMLACARIGATHVVVFDGFSPNALRERIESAGCSIVVTATHGRRAGRLVALKAKLDKAAETLENGLKRVVVVRRDEASDKDNDVAWVDGRDLWFHELNERASDKSSPVEVEATHPLFILHTSGTAEKSLGVIHSTGGYLLHAAMSFRHFFDYRDGDVHWCPANVGWITGHSYVIYGPLANAATTVMFEGAMSYPDINRYWHTIERHRVNSFYTVPSAIRTLRAQATSHVEPGKLQSLRVIGSVGEAIDRTSWQWLYESIGNSRCSLVDTWWQTETGGIMMGALPGAHPMKPGTVGKPWFGVSPQLLDADGNELDGEAEGRLVIADSWPGQAIGLLSGTEEFIARGFARFPGYYDTADVARRDADGHFRITGRVDDCIHVLGHTFGSADIESVLIEHPLVREAGVVQYIDSNDHPAIFAFVRPTDGTEADDVLRHQLLEHIRGQLGNAAVPETILWVPGLPNTRSGKLLRRLLRKVAASDSNDLGDLAPLADAGIVDTLLELRSS